MRASSYRIFYRTLEPVHVGTGGYRLGRVDKSICREPGTNLPKIPGTSLSGAARAYAAELCGRSNSAGAASPKTELEKQCPIFYTFGHASDSGGGNAGTVSVGDAYILLFPVSSLAGPVWITTRRLLNDAGYAQSAASPRDGKSFDAPILDREQIAAPSKLFEAYTGGLNLGWLWFAKNEGRFAAWTPPSELPSTYPVILVPDLLLAPIVNSNLEVRTSVSIDHQSGTAAKTKLFSYEAIPRNTILFHEVVEDVYRADPFENTMAGITIANGDAWGSPIDVLTSGLGMMKLLGVGGMGTRGFGRMEVFEPRTPIDKVVTK